MGSDADYGVELDGWTFLLCKREPFVTCKGVEQLREGGESEVVDALCFDVETGRAQAVAGDGFASCAGFGERADAVIGSFLEEFLEVDDLSGLQEVMSAPLRARLEDAAVGTGLEADAEYRYPLLSCAVYANRFRGYPSAFFRACALLDAEWTDLAACLLPRSFHDVPGFYDALGLDPRKRVRAAVVANPWPLLIRESVSFLGASPAESRLYCAARSLDENEMLDILRDAADNPAWFRGFVRRWSRVRRLVGAHPLR